MYREQQIPPNGPLIADQICESDRLELSEGRPIYCAPAAYAMANITQPAPWFWAATRTWNGLR
uniref:Uncharacterized protein n=1 Tax=Candidatus Kentrum sp. MB TaxID=2138164 RepID=A0A450XDY8_9GAMM|nr:MAG: hypothetical protein BECKMB1821I_GA0114274_100360 [Candidatus Kentron sp. MB]VFK74330.1 MAG: hypothetical protein BECKMB1821H_GA0114242_100360 [Candidatus Kentron sp. MB]